MTISVRISDMPMQKSKSPRIILNWILESLGVITRSEHGDDYTSIVMLLMEKIQGPKKNPVTAEEIQKRVGLKRSTVYKYIGRLMDVGIVKKIGLNRYILSDGRLSRVIDDIRSDVNKILEKIRERAEILDKESLFLEDE